MLSGEILFHNILYIQLETCTHHDMMENLSFLNLLS